jgi:hypothetical protein
LRTFIAIAALFSFTVAGCIATDGGRGGGGSGPTPLLDACPPGGTLRVTLWDVYATPRRPDGDVWDGVEAGTIELICDIAAEQIRNRVRDAARAQLGGAAETVDQLVGDAFEAQVAELCGLAGNWLQMDFEGPDLAAFGAFDGDADWRWETIQVEDTWAARLNTTISGAPAAWEIPCDTSAVAVLTVVDRDLAFDDDVATVGLDLTVPDEVICDGWGYYEGADGVAGLLVRLDVLGATPVCPL